MIADYAEGSLGRVIAHTSHFRKTCALPARLKLQSVAGQPPDDEKFKRQLAEEGEPKAICDMLFAQYVAGKSDRGRSSKRRRAGRSVGQAAVCDVGRRVDHR